MNLVLMNPHEVLQRKQMQYLRHIINSSLEEGCVPSTLKIAAVVPTRKVTNIKNASELRPINMLPALGKILEI